MLEAADFASEVQSTLEGGDFGFRREVGLAGSRVDFLVLGPAGYPLAALEVTTPRLEQAPQRLHLSLLVAASYGETLRGLPVLVVVPDSLESLADNRRIVVLSRLTERLRELAPVGLANAQAAALIQPASTRTVFASMPFSEGYVDTFKAIRYAARKVDAVAVRVDHDYAASDVVARIKAGINESAFVVVDVSEGRPSVLHEYGFAEAASKPIIAITSTGRDALPFNVRNNTTHQYVRGNYVPLRRLLLAAFREQISRLGAAGA
jgi:hypothetical protein